MRLEWRGPELRLDFSAVVGTPFCGHVVFLSACISERQWVKTVKTMAVSSQVTLYWGWIYPTDRQICSRPITLCMYPPSTQFRSPVFRCGNKENE